MEEEIFDLSSRERRGGGRVRERRRERGGGDREKEEHFNEATWAERSPRRFLPLTSDFPLMRHRSRSLASDSQVIRCKRKMTL